MNKLLQPTIFEYLKPHQIEIKGLCDDGYCPNCGNCVDFPPERIDAEYCSYCGIGLDWEKWHVMNDED